MIQHYLKILLRTTNRQKNHALINIASLAIGLSCAILVLLFVKYELSFDRYHENFSRICRVLREHRGDPTWSNSSEHPLAAALKQDFPDVVKATRVKKNDEVGVVEHGEKRFYEEGLYFADQDFLDIFTFPLITGNESTALQEPFSVLLTEEMAEKYFGAEDPVGKTLQIKEWYSVKKYLYTIRGVLKNIPKNSHFRFDFLIPYNTLYSLKSGGKGSVETWSYFEPKTYVRLAPHTEPGVLEEKFPAFLRKYKGEDSESEKMHLQPLKDIHLGGNMRFELEPNSDMRLIYVYSAAAFFILVIACLNYANLSVARSAKRAVEVGLRKVAGADRRQLLLQFLGESVSFSILAYGFSLLAVEVALPAFGALTRRDLTSNLFHHPDWLAIFFGVAVIAGLLSGSYPALLASSFEPLQIIKGTLRIGSKSSALFRNSLVVFQFVVSIILLVATFAIHGQLNYMRRRDLGFDKEMIVTVYAMDTNLKRNPEPFKKELLKNSDIHGIAASLDLPTTIRRSLSVGWDGPGAPQKTEMNFTFVDDDFFRVYDIETKRGRNFSPDFPADKGRAIVLNETAARDLGWDDPVGRTLLIQGREWTIIGVVEDFNFQSLHWRIDPLVFAYYEGRGMDYFSIKVGPDHIPRTLAFIEEIWREMSPEFPFQYAFLDERIDRLYKAEQRLGRGFNVFSLLALSVACLGLFGLVSFILERKRKEISIRKILGADFPKIIVLLAKDYLKCIAVAVVIGSPIGYFAMNKWLQTFAYHEDLGIDVFVLSALLVTVFALGTVAYQSVKAAVTNPVDTLRYE